MKNVFRVVALWLLAAIAACAACAEVAGDEVRLSDFALTRTPVEPDMVVMKAPLWGISRKVSPLEQRRIATLLPGVIVPSDLCVERPSQQVSDHQLLAAVQRHSAEVVGLDATTPTRRLPAGLIDITRLGAAHDGITLIEGQVSYGARSAYHFTERVRLHWRYQALVSTRELPAGTRLEPGDVVAGTIESVERPATLSTEVQWLGGRVRRTLSSGVPLSPADLQPPDVVEPGDTITMEVQCGGASLLIPAVALNHAAIGSSIKARTVAGKQLQGKLVSKQKGLIRVAL